MDSSEDYAERRRVQEEQEHERLERFKKQPLSKSDMLDQLKDHFEITGRELAYWTRIGVIVPSVANPQSQGKTNFYNWMDVIDAAVTKRMLASGLNLKTIKRVMDYLRKLSADARAEMYDHARFGPFNLVVTDPNSEDMRIGPANVWIPPEPWDKFYAPHNDYSGADTFSQTIWGQRESIFIFDLHPAVSKILNPSKM